MSYVAPGSIAPMRRAPRVSKSDVFAQYGLRGADMLLKLVKSHPPAERRDLLHEIFDEVDPTLWHTVAEKTEKFRRTKHQNIDTAFRNALAASLANGFATEVYAIGESRTPRALALGGLGYTGIGLAGLDDGYEQLGWNPISAIKSGVKGAYKGIKAGVKGAYKGMKNGAGGVWNGTKWVTQKAWDAAKGLGKLACSILKSPAAPAAGAAVGGLIGAKKGDPKMGAQIGATAVVAASAVCHAAGGGSGSSAPQETLPAEPQGFMANLPIVPIALGGAALLGVFVITSQMEKKGSGS